MDIVFTSSGLQLPNNNSSTLSLLKIDPNMLHPNLPSNPSGKLFSKISCYCPLGFENVVTFSR
jgi:hypothetical protein